MADPRNDGEVREGGGAKGTTCGAQPRPVGFRAPLQNRIETPPTAYANQAKE